MYEVKMRLLEAMQRIFGEKGQNPRRQKYGMIRSNEPRMQKLRKAHQPKPRKPAPKGRAELVARQKKARPYGNIN